MAFVRVACSEDDKAKAIGIPTEKDGSLLVVIVGMIFDGVTSLKYYVNDGWRAVRIADDKFHPPESGWGDNIYYCIFSKAAAKSKEDDAEYASICERLNHLIAWELLADVLEGANFEELPLPQKIKQTYRMFKRVRDDIMAGFEEMSDEGDDRISDIAEVVGEMDILLAWGKMQGEMKDANFKNLSDKDKEEYTFLRAARNSIIAYYKALPPCSENGLDKSPSKEPRPAQRFRKWKPKKCERTKIPGKSHKIKTGATNYYVRKSKLKKKT